MKHFCEHCGQPIAVKFGVKFPPLKASMLDMIEDVTKGRGGIESDALAWVFFPGVPKFEAKKRIRVHINQINDMLVSTDWRVVNARRCKNEQALYQLKEVGEAA